MTDDEILREWNPVGWMALTFVILLGVVGILLSGCAPLPPPAPAAVELVRSQSPPTRLQRAVKDGEPLPEGCHTSGRLEHYHGACGWLGGWGCWTDALGATWAVRCVENITATSQEIARDQAQQANEFSPQVAGLTLLGVFTVAFFWAIRKLRSASP